MSATRLQRIRSVLEQRQFDFTVILENVHKPHNLSAIMRSCDAVGVPEAHAIQSDVSFNKMPSHTAAGSDRWVKVTQHQTTQICLNSLKAKGFKIYAAHFSDQSHCFRDIDLTTKTAVLFGQEKWGVSETAAKQADGHVIIPMHGMVESLNVSVAAALVLYEMQRQRQQKDQYQHCQLSKSELKKWIFEWCQPKMAKYYQQKNLPYPDLDEDGDILS